MLTKKKLLAEFVGRHRMTVAAAFLFGLLSIIATVLIPVFLGKYYQIALHRHSTRGQMFDVLFGHMKGIVAFSWAFGALIVAKFIADFLKKYYLGITGELLAKDTRESLFERQLNARLDAHQRKDTGLYLLRYTGDLSAIQHYLTKGVITFLNDCLHLVLAVTVLALLNLRLTAILLASYPFVFGIILYLNKRLKILTGKRRNRRSNNLSFVTGRFGALLTIKAFNRQGIESEKYRKGSTDLYQYGVKYHRLYAFIYALLPFMLYGMLAILLWVAYEMKHHSHHKIHGHDLLTFIMTAVGVIPVLKRILNVNFVWQAGDISFTKLLRVYNARQETLRGEQETDLPAGDIVFDHVSFGFDKKRRVFEKLSFRIQRNTVVQLSGPHQSGKSTVLKLICGLYEPSGGTIHIGGTDIAKVGKSTLRRRVTIVSDEFPLIGKTIFEAVSYSRKEEKRLPALEMLKKVGYCGENDTESVLDQPLKENGRNLSYSQRRLLLLARAFLTNKRILLLDEPFEGLDEKLSANVVSLITDYKEKHTVLIVNSKRDILLPYDADIVLAKNESNLTSA